jgi:chemotaxis protein methyltransferase CheR
MRWPGFRKVRGQVCKRVSRRLRALDLADGVAYRSYLEGHPAEWALLDGLCRITISRFYRDRAVFDALKDRGFLDLARAALVRGESTVRCWSVGCASGEEPYSLSLAWAMSESRREVDASLEIVATEVDAGLIERARAACYPAGALKELPAEWIRSAFTETDEGFDLVLCRNLVFTYFESGLQAELLLGMLERVQERGLLVVGGHEALPPGVWPLDRPYGALPIYRRLARLR